MNNITQIFLSGQADGVTWLLLFATAFVGGIISSISPCSLAMLPLMIGYVGGCSKETPIRTFVQLCCFIFGTAVVFTIIGILCAITGSVFASVFGGYFTLIMASLLLTVGLKIVGFLDFEIPVIIKSMPVNNTNSLFLYPFLLGVAFALAGTPCSTPILAGIMVFAAMGKNLIAATIMLFLFAIGQGIILIAAGMFTSEIKNIKRFSNYTDILVKTSGWLLILAAIYLFYKTFVPII